MLKGKVESVQNKAGKSRKRVGRVLSIFTEMLSQLEKEKDELVAIVDANNEIIAETSASNIEVEQEIAKVDNVISNLSKIIKG